TPRTTIILSVGAWNVLRRSAMCRADCLASGRAEHKPRSTAMKLPRRRFLQLAAGAAALPALSRIAKGQTYPTRPVRLIAPFSPGGVSAILARVLWQWLSERLGQPFVNENRPGAGGNIGTEAVVRAPPD